MVIPHPVTPLPQGHVGRLGQRGRGEQPRRTPGDAADVGRRGAVHRSRSEQGPGKERHWEDSPTCIYIYLLFVYIHT